MYLSVTPSLLTLVPPPLMVAPVCRVANTSLPISPNTPSLNMSSQSRPTSHSSICQSREDSTSSRMSTVSASTTEYCDRVEKENNMDIDSEKNPPWADQVEATLTAPSGSIKEVSIPTFSFNTHSRIPHKDPSNMPPIHAPPQHEVSTPPGPTVIPYNEKYPVDPFLWDGKLSAVSIFGTNKFFDQDSANIIVSIQ